MPPRRFAGFPVKARRTHTGFRVLQASAKAGQDARDAMLSKLLRQPQKLAQPKASAPAELALPGRRVRPPVGEGAAGDSGGAQIFCADMNVSYRASANRNHRIWSRWKLRMSP